MTSIDARLRALEKVLDEDALAVVVLFGEDPVPEDLPSSTTVLRFDERFREV
jgi:hypothetical protein